MVGMVVMMMTAMMMVIVMVMAIAMVMMMMVIFSLDSRDGASEDQDLNASKTGKAKTGPPQKRGTAKESRKGISRFVAQDAESGPQEKR